MTCRLFPPRLWLHHPSVLPWFTSGPLVGGSQASRGPLSPETTSLGNLTHIQLSLLLPNSDSPAKNPVPHVNLQLDLSVAKAT